MYPGNRQPSYRVAFPSSEPPCYDLGAPLRATEESRASSSRQLPAMSEVGGWQTIAPGFLILRGRVRQAGGYIRPATLGNGCEQYKDRSAYGGWRAARRWGHMRLKSLAPGFASGPVMRAPTASGAVAERGLPRELSPPPPVGEPVSVFADIRDTPLGRVARFTTQGTSGSLPSAPAGSPTN